MVFESFLHCVHWSQTWILQLFGSTAPNAAGQWNHWKPPGVQVNSVKPWEGSQVPWASRAYASFQSVFLNKAMGQSGLGQQGSFLLGFVGRCWQQWGRGNGEYFRSVLGLKEAENRKSCLNRCAVLVVAQESVDCRFEVRTTGRDWRDQFVRQPGHWGRE